MQININSFWAKIILRLNPFDRLLVMCKGYSEDYYNFTELVWRDYKDLCFYDREIYPQFQLWVI